jgi:hypothetical protein
MTQLRLFRWKTFYTINKKNECIPTLRKVSVREARKDLKAIYKIFRRNKKQFGGKRNDS